MNAQFIELENPFKFCLGYLTSLEAAPLLCGGTTVFSPFLEYKAFPTAHIGIISIGGLGYFALQSAKKFGA